MYVTKVGIETMYGKLSLELGDDTNDSPLKTRLKTLASTISKYGYIGAFLVAFSYLFSVIVLEGNFDMLTNYKVLFGHLMYAITLAVTVIVVAVPEGLPMMITLVLSSNMKRMIKKNVLVRKLVGIETAGSMNILFTYKTGTLTKGKLSVNSYVSPNLREFISEEALYDSVYYNMVKKACTYSSSTINEKGEVVGGNSTDKAIREFIRSSTNYFSIEKEVEFNSASKYSSVTVDRVNYIKGAPEVILNSCKKYLDENNTEKFLLNRKEINDYIIREASKGIRVVALSYSRYGPNIDPLENSVLLGLILLKDQIKENVKETVAELKEAGIKVVMVTGDNKETATNIAKEVGILTNGVVLTSGELNKMSDEEVIKILPRLEVLARSLPTDKSRLVYLAQKKELVVGMTGDGVNDAPALKKADVGFAMGSGTEVSKEAGDIIILDDNLQSIESAVLFGRTIFKSIRKFIIFQLTVNMCAVSLSIIGPFIGIESPITVVQMLWINMVMDTLAGLAFSFEPPLKEYMKEKPKKRNERIINKYMKNEIMFTGAYSSLLCIIFLKSNYLNSIFNHDLNKIFTAFFGLFIFIAIFNSFNARTSRLNILADVFRNKVFLIVLLFIVVIQTIMIYYGGNVFRTSGLSLLEFNLMIILASTVMPIDMIRKLYMKKYKLSGGV
jgi:calcium-translocating P-type ATPase